MPCQSTGRICAAEASCGSGRATQMFDRDAVCGSPPISGEYPIRPDGKILLGFYGEVFVAGLPLGEIRQRIAAHLADNFGIVGADVAVDVLAFNTGVYYVISDAAGFGEQIVNLPFTGSETVLDAVAEIGRSDSGSSCTTGSR